MEFVKINIGYLYSYSCMRRSVDVFDCCTDNCHHGAPRFCCTYVHLSVLFVFEESYYHLVIYHVIYCVWSIYQYRSATLSFTQSEKSEGKFDENITFFLITYRSYLIKHIQCIFVQPFKKFFQLKIVHRDYIKSFSIYYSFFISIKTDVIKLRLWHDFNRIGQNTLPFFLCQSTRLQNAIIHMLQYLSHINM